MKARYFSHKEFPSILDVVNRVISCTYSVDRVGLHNPIQVDYEPIPTHSVGGSLEDVCAKRAEYLWSQHDVINLMWSGGIDSTLAYYMLKATKPHHCSLNVRYTQHSIDEYPLMWEQEFRDIPTLTIDELTDIDNVEGVFVTGACADELCTALSGRRYGELMNERWIDTYLAMDEQMLLQLHPDTPTMKPTDFADLRRRFFEFAFEFVDYAPIEIETVFDFRWWLGFAFKWQREIMHLSIDVTKNPEHLARTVPFFNDADLQAWTIRNFDQLHEGTWESIKCHYRKVIFQHNGDGDYLKNKRKINSFMNVPARTYGERKSRREDPNNIKLLLDDGRFWRNSETIPDDVLDEIREC